MELWDLYNKDRVKTGKTMVRGEKMGADCYHLVVHICIFNAKGEMLIQQRQPFKEGWPNMWDISVGGSAVQGDDSQRAAEREVQEELGLTIDLQGVRPNMTINFSQGFDDVYLIEKEVNLDELVLQESEVQAARWASKEEILKLIREKKFIPYYESLIQLFFDSRSQYGCHANQDQI